MQNQCEVLALIKPRFGIVAKQKKFINLQKLKCEYKKYTSYFVWLITQMIWGIGKHFVLLFELVWLNFSELTKVFRQGRLTYYPWVNELVPILHPAKTKRLF